MKKIEIFIKKIFFKIFLLISKKNTLSEKPVINSGSMILFVRLNRIGDALVTTPLLHQVKKNIGCKIYVLADKKNYFIFEHCPDVDATIIHEKGLRGIQKLNSFIRKNKVDVIVDLHDDVSVTVSILISISNCKYKFGIKKENQKIYTHTVERLKSDTHHIIERTLEFAKLFGFQPNYENAKVSYQIKESSLNFAQSQLIKYKEKFLLGINITAGSDARFWGVENFKSLIELLSSYDLNYIVFTTENKSEVALQITDKKFIYPASNDFDTFAAGISQMDMLFTPDTSVIHIASLFKIPVFGLYVKYKTEDMIWSPYKTDFEFVVTQRATLEDISFNQVKEKFIPFLEKHIYEKRNSGL